MISRNIRSMILIAFVVFSSGIFQSRAETSKSIESGFLIPLNSAENWQVLKYNNIKANEVGFTKEGLRVNVMKSANPVIFPFAEGKTVSRVIAKGVLLDGSLNIPVGVSQDSRGADDYVFKLGLVEKGDKSLNWLQRSFAPSWVKTLFELAPDDSGIAKIHFLNVVQNKKDVGKGREHASSDLVYEENITFLDSNTGAFQIEKTFDNPLDILALWLSIDGDDTGSSFSVLIKFIELG